MHGLAAHEIREYGTDEAEDWSNGNLTGLEEELLCGTIAERAL